MNIILSDKQLNIEKFPANVKVEYITYKMLDRYNRNSDVIAIIGSRSMAIKAADMEFSRLRFFQLTSAGYDGVPFDKYAKKNIMVANAGDVYSAPIAETVVFGMLSVSKKLHKNPNNRHLKLQRHYDTITELANKKVLIMGAGNIGTAVAKRLVGFEMQIDGYDPFCEGRPQYHKIIRNREELIKKMKDYDFIVSTLPDNEQTKGFVNHELFSVMKKSAVIVNVGRKAVFDENNFYQALKKEIIGGAILDIFEKIPNPIQNKFRRLSNVIVLPGVAAISQEVVARLQLHITENLLALLHGEKIKNVIN